MEAVTAGTLAGAGSFRCEACGFAIALHERDEVPACPHCDGRRFRRSSIFGEQTQAEPWGHHRGERPGWLDKVRESLVADGDYLAYDDDEGIRVLALEEGWTRIGRSLAAQIRFDDPTVSRRHALIHRSDGKVRVLDDRSLNGVWVNGERVDWQELEDGDEIAIGRFNLYFLSPAGQPAAEAEDEVGTAAT